MSTADTPAPVKSALRTVEVLEFFAQHPGPYSLAALQQELGYPKSSLYMLLRTLADAGWVETDATGTLYGIGVRALLVGTSYIDGDELVSASRDAMEWLSETTGETVHLARADGRDMVYLATHESRHYLRPISRIGRRLPAHATSLGKALLAQLPEQRVRELVGPTPESLTDHTLTDAAALDADLELTRERGYAVDHEENTLGLRCFGVAVRTEHPARSALSCSVPLARLDEGAEQRVVDALFTARERLERAVRRR